MSVRAYGLEGWPEELVEAIKKIASAYEEIVQKAKEFAKIEADCVSDERKVEREAWREAALLAGQRAEARAKAFGLQATLEKARRAMRRRKRLHADGGLPDW